jgi:lipopolysaccharide/colanic/teichoic acid biosynthesis glycosyltransferase
LPNTAVKRGFDLVMALSLLCITAPLMAVIALLVKLNSSGPVFYCQMRVGLNRRRRAARAGLPPERRCRAAFGRCFKMIKFRTMHTDAELNGATWSPREDPRVTPLGRVLRKSHLDELPQLFNVLLGDMSIVGPRPERPEFVVQLRQAVPKYDLRLQLKPGLTGLAQIRQEADQAFHDVKRKVRYDLLYMQKASTWTDLKIVLGTVPLALGFSPEQLKQATRMRLPSIRPWERAQGDARTASVGLHPIDGRPRPS